MFGAQYDRTGWAGYFAGNVYVAGVLEKWVNFFKIDHPLDPANKVLRHSVVESSEMKNMYDGTATLDARGEAVVELPVWFEALNRDFRYQLTAIGAASPNLHVAKAISKGRFSIAGGASGGPVCWQVTGTRQDAAALAHPLKVEEEKAPHERGSFQHPAAQRAADDKGAEHRMRSRIRQASGRAQSRDARGGRHGAAARRLLRTGQKRRPLRRATIAVDRACVRTVSDALKPGSLQSIWVGLDNDRRCGSYSAVYGCG